MSIKGKSGMVEIGASGYPFQEIADIQSYGYNSDTSDRQASVQNGLPECHQA